MILRNKNILNIFIIKKQHILSQSDLKQPDIIEMSYSWAISKTIFSFAKFCLPLNFWNITETRYLHESNTADKQEQYNIVSWD